jgi:thymidylate kinase
MDTVELIDIATPEPVLVIGSLPPGGRDLDLLVHPAAETALAEALAANGFHAQGRVWALFADCTAHVVELIPASTLGLDGVQLDQLFADAQALERWPSLRSPAPHHRLLLLARSVAAQGRLQTVQRKTAEEADDATWDRARDAAPAWRADTALQELEGALRGRAPRSWPARFALARLRWYRPGAVVALSGLDGSGKSTQAEGLDQALSMLGYRTVRVWTSLPAHPGLELVAAPARALLGARRETPAGEEDRAAAGEDDDRLTRLRESRRLLHLAWVTYVAALNAWWQARAVRPQLLRGRIVICDRYTLDSVVNLRYRYGERSRYRAQRALISLLSPRPLRAYLLQVSPDVAYARNQEFTRRQVEFRARLYHEEHGELAVTCLDGERTSNELCAQIALEVWSALSLQRDARSPAPMRALLAVHRAVSR